MVHPSTCCGEELKFIHLGNIEWGSGTRNIQCKKTMRIYTGRGHKTSRSTEVSREVLRRQRKGMTKRGREDHINGEGNKIPGTSKVTTE